MKTIIQEIFKQDLIKLIISNPRHKEGTYKRIMVRKIELKGTTMYQVEKFTDKQAFHENLQVNEVMIFIEKALTLDFKQCDAFTTTMNYMIKISKKEKVFVSKKKVNNSTVKVTHDHNRTKQYLIPDGCFIAPLYDLGIFTKEGNIVQSMYDKYKQINRFIEMIDDCLTDDMKHLNIIDFGCGKSYLTFILYYYLVEVKHRTVNMIGLDLKEEVIQDCNNIAKKYGYDHLHFEIGNINGYQCEEDIDMVISLHACDTATDHALYNAITWNAKMIFSVPCCQHELNAQMQSEQYSIVTRYGLIKERTAALLTDAIRANLLQCASYQVQVLEFIDLAHSPKNILLRCVKNDKISFEKKQEAKREVESIIEEFHVQPTLYNLLKETLKQF